MGGVRSSCSSSGEEDGDADWMAAINSVTSSASNGATHQDKDEKDKPQKLKHYQIKVFFFYSIWRSVKSLLSLEIVMQWPAYSSMIMLKVGFAFYLCYSKLMNVVFSCLVDDGFGKMKMLMLLAEPQ